MLDPAFVRDYPDQVRTGLRSRGLDPEATLQELGELETRRRQIIPDVEGLKREQNSAGEQVARAKREGRDVSELLEGNKTRSQRIKQLQADLDAIESRRLDALLMVPNLPHASVPVGASAADNVEVRRHGDPRTFAFKPQPHWDLGPALGILDFERATRMSGARFSVLMGAGAKLERALINFMLDLHTREHGYTEVEPPFLVNRAALTGTGNLPKFEADLFRIAGEWDLFLVPTAEVPLTNLHRGEILDGRRLPIRYTAYTPCFRSEAGSYGQDVRGLIRQHQFDKVELMSFTTPDRSVRRARAAHRLRRRSAEAARAAVPDDGAVHGRHGLRVGEDVRHRGLAAEPGDLSRDLVVQQHRGVPGAPVEHQVPARRHRQGRARPHAERIRAGRRPHVDRDPRELPAAGRLGRHSRRPPPVHGRDGSDRAFAVGFGLQATGPGRHRATSPHRPS